MIPTQIVVTIYLMFAFVASLPWFMLWATKGTTPVISRLLSLFVFAFMLTDAAYFLWRVHSENPERMGDARNLLAPLIAISVIGLLLTFRSLVKVVKDTMPKS